MSEHTDRFTPPELYGFEGEEPEPDGADLTDYERHVLDHFRYPGECAEWLAKHRRISFAEGLALARAWDAENDA
jgi:hypothetical protein